MRFPGPRLVNGVVWHQGGPGYAPLSFANPATVNGRYSKKGGPGAWYGSSQEQGAWAELVRHHHGGISPFEVRRRVARVRITDLRALDLMSPATRRTLGVAERDLAGVTFDYSYCQWIANEAWHAGYEGILAPSGALPGQRTVVVFDRGISRLNVERDVVKRMPNRMLDVIDRIPMPKAVRDELEHAIGGLIRAQRAQQARNKGAIQQFHWSQ